VRAALRGADGCPSIWTRLPRQPEEIFGPWWTVTPFRSEAEVIGYANGTEFGLCASPVDGAPGAGAPRGGAAGDGDGVGETAGCCATCGTPFGASSRAGGS